MTNLMRASRELFRRTPDETLPVAGGLSTSTSAGSGSNPPKSGNRRGVQHAADRPSDG